MRKLTIETAAPSNRTVTCVGRSEKNRSKIFHRWGQSLYCKKYVICSGINTMPPGAKCAWNRPAQGARGLPHCRRDGIGRNFSHKLGLDCPRAEMSGFGSTSVIQKFFFEVGYQFSRFARLTTPQPLLMRRPSASYSPCAMLEV